VFGFLRRRARENGIPGGQCGVTAIQRFGSALNLAPHFHALVFDGVYAAVEGERPRFYPLRPRDRNDVETVARHAAERVAALPELEDEDGNQPALSAVYGASVMGRIAGGPNAGRKVRTAGPEDGDQESFEKGVRCAVFQGFSIHAGVQVRGGDRRALERLCRYISRPPLAADRLKVLPGGRLSYQLKAPWRNGTTHVIFEPLEFLEKLAALIPAPRTNLIRYHGVLGPTAKWRSQIVPAASDSNSQRCAVTKKRLKGSSD
jgi:hypothetical protein